MTAKLMVKEVGDRDFSSFNGDYPSPEAATAEGERLAVEGNVEAFQVWDLVTTRQRVWKLEEVEPL